MDADNTYDTETKQTRLNSYPRIQADFRTHAHPTHERIRNSAAAAVALKSFLMGLLPRFLFSARVGSFLGAVFGAFSVACVSASGTCDLVDFRGRGSPAQPQLQVLPLDSNCTELVGYSPARLRWICRLQSTLLQARASTSAEGAFEPSATSRPPLDHSFDAAPSSLLA